jgi:hypothetical protein
MGVIAKKEHEDFKRLHGRAMQDYEVFLATERKAGRPIKTYEIDPHHSTIKPGQHDHAKGLP